MLPIRDILNQNLAEAVTVAVDDDPSSVTNRQWARKLAPISSYRLWPPVGEVLDQFLLPEGEDDEFRLDSKHVPVKEMEAILKTERDSMVSWRLQVAQPVLQVFNQLPVIMQSTGDSPVAPSNPGRHANNHFYWRHHGSDHCIAVGEIRARGSIVPEDWKTRRFSDMSKGISQELRGYAYNYGTCQAYLYDGLHLLLIQFRASRLEEILSASCDVDCTIIPRTSGDKPGHCTVRYALYRFLVQGIRRCVGESAPRLAIKGVRRSYEFWSGRPKFAIKNRGYTSEWPAGCHREYEACTGAWYWTFDDSVDVTWDTYGQVS